MSDWNPEKSAKLYGTDGWGKGFFRINKAGHVVVTPDGETGKV